MTQVRYFTSYISPVSRLWVISFLAVNILMFYYLYDTDEPHCIKEGTCRIYKQDRILPREKWGQTIYFKILTSHFQRYQNEWRLISGINISSSVDSKYELNCSSLQHIDSLNFLAAGWTKSTYKAVFKNKILSLKVVNIYGHDMTSCLAEKDRYLYDCFLLTASKLLREMTLLRTISHPNVVKVLGYCVPADPDVEDPLRTISIVEEYGESINVIKMLQLSWEDRLRISLGLSRLLKHLASFKDPIALNDFRRQQFVMVEGEPKLIDVDDVGLQEPKCNSSPCCFSWNSPENKSACIPCVDGVCRGYNEKLNIIRTGAHFIRHILPHGAPSSLNPFALKITYAFELGLGNSNYIFKEMEDMTAMFISGEYRNSSGVLSSGFREIKQHDLPVEYDYRCQLSSGYGCSFSAYNAEEAAEICILDSECKAFVVSAETTWTGRKMVYFKNGNDNVIKNNMTTLYLKK